jgi:uncharacterized protein (TIGR03435 family)
MALPVSGGTLVMQHRTLAQLIAAAYHVRPGDISGPAWIAQTRFDLQAKLPAGASPASADRMLQALLAERFGLLFHRETREAAGFALMASKDGSRLTAGVPQAAPADSDDAKRQLDQRLAEVQSRVRQGRMSGQFLAAAWSSKNATMAELAGAVSSMVQAPVEDHTGLTGTYQVNLEMRAAESAVDTLEYRVGQALAPLGLRIEPRKVKVDAIVIDQVNQTPTEN